MLGWLMLPNPKDSPSLVYLDGHQLCDRVRHFGRALYSNRVRWCVVCSQLWAPVPETAIHKDGEAPGCEDDSRTDTNIPEIDSDTLTEPVPEAVQD